MKFVKNVITWIGIVFGVVLGSAILWPYLNYGNAEYWRKEGSRLLRKKSYERALEVYDHLNALDPVDVDAWDSKADILYRLKRYGEAIESYDKVLSFDPENYNAALLKAQALGLAGQSEDALDVYDQLIEAGADNPVKMTDGESPPPSFEILVLEGKANELMKLRRYDEALIVYDDAIRKAPQDPILRNARSWPLMSLKRYKDIVKNSEFALTMNPDSALASLAWNNKGAALSSLKQYSDALDAYDRAFQLKPDNALVWYNRARVHAMMGSQDSAVSYLRTAIELHPALKGSFQEDEVLQSLKDLAIFK